MASIPDSAQTPAGEAAPAGDETSFSAAFAERSADLSGQKKKPEPDGAEPSSKEPAEAGSSEAPADAAAKPDASGTAEQADPWKDLTPEQLRQRLVESEAERNRLQASERSQRGRVGALTRKLNTLSASTPAPSPAPTPAAKETPGSDETPATAESLEDRLKKVTEEYGDVVGPIAEMLTEVRAEIASIKKPAQTASEVDADAEELTKAYETLEKAHPDYIAVSQDANFTAWLGDQPAKVQELINSFDPREVSLGLTLFKTERSAALASQASEKGDTGKPASTATDDKRQRQLEGSRQVQGKTQPSAAGVPNDFSSAFKARVAAIAAG
jgi:DNA repair exonuclease SbcCD ATPase subunit